jgi:phosphopantothenoylcysteine decarboxylase/phosphopantothenate--cysteine ligase
MADDLASTVALAARATMVIAPAMNVNMWDSPTTQQNVELLKERGAVFVDPVEGELACGWVGKGRLAPLDRILDAIDLTTKSQDMAGTEVIVTAGPTREYIDPIRYISNRSSGKMGYEIAREAHLRGANVRLITGPTGIEPPYGVDTVCVTSAHEMNEAVKACVAELEQNPPASVFVFKAAAVCDHRPEITLDKKGKGNKGKNMSLPLVSNVDILEELGKARAAFAEKTERPLVLVGFAAETGTDEELEESAKDKLSRKGCDMIVANLADDSFGRDTSRVFFADRNGRWLAYKEAPKSTVARHIVSHAKSLIYDAKPGSRREQT